LRRKKAGGGGGRCRCLERAVVMWAVLCFDSAVMSPPGVMGERKLHVSTFATTRVALLTGGTTR